MPNSPSVEELTFAISLTGEAENSIAVISFGPGIVEVPDSDLPALTNLFLGAIEQARETILRRACGIALDDPDPDGEPNGPDFDPTPA